MLKPEYRQGNLFLPGLGLWLDPHEPQTGSDVVFVSHAHSDHIAPHREVVLSHPTALLMRDRLPGTRKETVLAYGEERRFENSKFPYSITLLPAGHILGSAMALIKAENESLLYTGDFKLRTGLSAEKCEPKHADVLVMETTFGRPQYRFPPTPDVLKGIVNFCREALGNDKTAVLFGYSLGKSQEILCALGEAHLPLVLHGSVSRLTEIYKQFGKCFPPYEHYASGNARGKVLLCPPMPAHSALLRNLGPVRSAVLTGWAVDPNCRYRYQCDAAFPLSDHADFPDLMEMVSLVSPSRVYTLHGFAADFAQTLRDHGVPAEALSEQEQFTLALGMTNRSLNPNIAPAQDTADVVTERSGPPQPETGFSLFAELCSRVSKESSKLAKVRLISDYLKLLPPDCLRPAVTWFTGRPFASSQNKVMQLGWAVLRDALCSAGELELSELHQVYLKHSDLGETAFEVLADKQEHAGISISQVVELFENLYAAKGPLAKRPILTAALRRASALEAKYLVKILTGDLRIGLKEGLLEEAVAAAFNQSADAIRKINLLLGDIGEVALLAHEDKLTEASMQPFRPIKLMLASPEETAEDVWHRMQDQFTSNEDGNPSTSETHSVWVEDKYDGIRCQLHKVGQRVSLYSRDLKDVTATFPDIADSARSLAEDFVLDGEIIAMRGELVLPFSELQKRLGRREADLFMREEIPVRYVVFDLLWRSGTTLLEQPLSFRRHSLESLLQHAETRSKGLLLARLERVSSAEQIRACFSAARNRGNEGLMIKNPESTYNPGRRGLAWLKLKQALASLDCVVVGAEYGHGKRSKVLSDYTFAVRDENTGELKVIGKAYSGLTDLEIQMLTDHFLDTTIRRHGRFLEVRPDTVLEIAFDRLQPSNRHNSGLAMRFPRILRIRTDKPVNEIDTLSIARKIAGVAGSPDLLDVNRTDQPRRQ